MKACLLITFDDDGQAIDMHIYRSDVDNPYVRTVMVSIVDLIKKSAPLLDAALRAYEAVNVRLGGLHIGDN